MIQPVHGRMSHASRRENREAVIRCLAIHGLNPKRRRGLSLVDGRGSDEATPARLRAVLEELGTAFKLFGVYLSTRNDLLPPRYIAEFSLIADCGEPEDLEELVPQRLFARFDPIPFESRLLFQQHRAWLQDGNAVTVKVIHPEAERLASDSDLLPLLEPFLGEPPWPPSLLESTIADFRRSVRERMDLGSEARALQALNRDAEDCDVVHVPRVRGVHAGGRVLVIDAVPSIEMDPEETARLISMAWLRQALLGQTFPIDVQLSDVRVASNSRIAFLCGEWAALASEPQSNLWEYLLATANEDADRACTFLLKETANADQCRREEELQRTLRQLVPFRHRELGDTAGPPALAERLLLQWRLAIGLGYIPGAHLPPFLRGLCNVARTIEQLVPDKDMLVEALRNVRVFDGMTRMRSILSVREMSNLADRYAAAFLQLPQRMDKLLTIGADGSANIRISLAEDPAAHRRKNANAMVSALVIVGAALLVLVDHLAAKRGIELSAQLSPIAFAGLGALVVWAVLRAS